MSSFSAIPQAEIGIRGNIPTYGKVLLYDDLEGVLKWAAVSVPAGGTVTKDTSLMFSKGASLKLLTDAGTPADDDLIAAYRDIYLKSSKRLRLESVFYIGDISINDEIDFCLNYIDAIDTRWAVLRYLTSGAKWQYRNSAGGMTDITGGAQTLVANSWNYVKLEVDFNTEKYLRMQCNYLDIELAGIDIELTGAGAGEQLRLYLYNYTGVATEAQVNIDEILLTEVE